MNDGRLWTGDTTPPQARTNLAEGLSSEERMRAMTSVAMLMMTLTLLRCGAANDVSSSPVSTPSAKQESWKVEIMTDGGITGKGLGSVQIDSSGHVVAAFMARHCDGQLTPEESAALSAAQAGAMPGSWRSSYATPGVPNGHPDEIHYSLVLTRGAKSYTTSWYGESGDTLPADLAGLRAAAWQARARTMANCK